MIKKSTITPEITFDANGEAGVIEAIVAVTGNVDHQNDVVEPGAFAKTLSAKKPKIVFSHDWKRPLGKTLSMTELMPGDPRLPETLREKNYGGLLVSGKFTLGDPDAKAVYEHLKAGSLDEFSIGFDIAADEKGLKAEKYEDNVRHIKSIDPLYEWSPVLYGANSATMPLAVKALITESKLDKFNVEIKQLPTLEGDEAQHNEPLTQALDALNTLMGQEASEDPADYNGTIQIASIANSLVYWAEGEGNDDTETEPQLMTADSTTNTKANVPDSDKLLRELALQVAAIVVANKSRRSN